MMILDWLAPLLALTVMEVVLGIDNVVFIAILVGRLPREQQARARQIGLALALGTRVLLLLALYGVIHYLTTPLFTLPDWGILSTAAEREVSWRDLVLLGGGLFLIAKSTYEIHSKLEGDTEEAGGQATSHFGWTLVQIAVLDIIFSLDSVITAVGMARQIWVMIVAMVVAMLVMLVFARAIGDFVHRHPTVKILALSFLILIGVMLMAEGFDKHIDRGYIYFAMAFSLVVELLNLRLRGRGSAVQLHEPQPPE